MSRTSMWDEEALITYIIDKTGKDRDLIINEREAFADNRGYAPIIRNQKNMLTFLFANEELNLDIPVEVPVAPEDPITLKEVMEATYTRRITTEGILVNRYMFLTKKQNDAVGFMIADKTMISVGKIYLTEAVSNWIDQQIPKMSFIKIQGCDTSTWEGRKEIRINERTKITINEEPPYVLEDLAKMYDELEAGDIALLCVPFLDIEEAPYNGCTECYKGVKDASAGEMGECETHGTVEVKLHPRLNITATDGENDIVISVAPWIIERTDQALLEKTGILLNVLGTKNAEDKFDASLIMLSSGSSTGALIGESERQEKFEKPVATMEKVKEQIPRFLDAWGKQTEEQIVNAIVKHLNADEPTILQAIADMVKEGKIELKEDKNYYNVKK